ncbi:MAG: 50S ribosomal protein L18 [bacterium]|nr:50S ribosomal protein L18 [bacterium]
MKTAREKKNVRHKRIRAKVSGTAVRPRLCVFRSSKHIYAQLINDEKGKVILAVSDLKLEKQAAEKSKVKDESKVVKVGQLKVDKAKEIGKLIAQKAKDSKIDKVVFDRGGYGYHGRVKAVAEGAREGGLKF